MSRGIIIFGSSGSGKTTLGKITAAKLGFPYYDIDDYIWRKDTSKPFLIMYSREEKIGRLLDAISKSEHFVMAGSMDSFHSEFDPFFDLAVHLTAPAKTRLERVYNREYALFGDRINKGGDLYESNQHFLRNVASYDTDGSPNMKTHSRWAAELSCKVLNLSGETELQKNSDIIVKELALVIKNGE